MNRITKKIAELKASGEKAYIPFITAGYPDLNKSFEIILEFEKAGADIVEIGIPFSDPLADGPTIQNSSHAALQNGITSDKVFSLIKKVRGKSQIPILVFAYTNLILQKGLKEFFSELKRSGCDGVLIPDLPVEEAMPFKNEANKHGISIIFLISPLTSDKRMRLIEKLSDDFVYCVSVTGVTGARKSIYGQIKKYLKRVKRNLSKPYMVGFGISNKQDAKNISSLCDGVVVGSAIINIIRDTGKDHILKKINKFSSEIKKVIN